MKNTLKESITFKNNWSSEYKHSITVYEKDGDKVRLRWLNKKGVQDFKSKYPKAVISVSQSNDGKYLENKMESTLKNIIKEQIRKVLKEDRNLQTLTFQYILLEPHSIYRSNLKDTVKGEVESILKRHKGIGSWEISTKTSSGTQYTNHTKTYTVRLPINQALKIKSSLEGVSGVHNIKIQS